MDIKIRYYTNEAKTLYTNYWNIFFKFLYNKLFNEQASLMDFGSSFHALAPQKLKDRCPVARRHLIKSNSLRFLVVRLWICERFLNFCGMFLSPCLIVH